MGRARFFHPREIGDRAGGLEDAGVSAWWALKWGARRPSSSDGWDGVNFRKKTLTPNLSAGTFTRNRLSASLEMLPHDALHSFLQRWSGEPFLDAEVAGDGTGLKE